MLVYERAIKICIDAEQPIETMRSGVVVAHMVP